MNARRYRMPAAVGAIGAVGVALYAGAWFGSAAWLREGLEGFARTQEARGWSLDYEEFRSSGFPFFLRGSIETPHLSAPNGAAWSAGRLVFDALPIRPDRVILTSEGPQTVNLGAAGLFDLETVDGRAGLSRPQGRPRADIEATRAALAAREGPARIGLEAFKAAALASSDAARGFETSATIASVTLDLGRGPVVLRGVEIFVRADYSSDRPAYELRHVSFSLGETTIDGAGTLAIDAHGALAGRIDAVISNPASLPEAFSRLGLIEAGEARGARFGFSIAEAAGGPTTIRAPIIFADGEARILGVTIARFAAADQAGSDPPR